MKALVKSCLIAATLSAVSASVVAAPIYMVNDVGLVKRYSGVNSGANPVVGGNFAIGNGELVATILDYGTYQGITATPDGRVLGVNGGGDVVQWNSVGSWLDNVTSTTLVANVFADKTNGNGPKSTGGAGTIHGLSYDGNTGGFYVTLEAADASDGDIREYATLADLLTNTGVDSASNYGGNLLNFYYPDEDAPGNRAAPNDTPGANYFQVAGNGQIEGFLTLADYVTNPGNRTFEQANFGAGLRAAFAIPEPGTLVLSVTAAVTLLALRKRRAA